MKFRTFVILIVTLLAGLVTHAWAQPYAMPAVEQCVRDYPVAWAAAHRGGPASDDFVILCARDLQKIDPNFGLNGKRGNPTDVSDDVIAYKGSGSAVDVRRNEPMEIIDVCASCGGASPSVVWNVGPGGPGDRGTWIDPFSVSPSVKPAPHVTPTPPTAPVPSTVDVAVLTVLQEIEKLLRAQVEAQVYTNQRLAALEEMIGTDPSPTTLAEIKAVLDNMVAEGSWFAQFNTNLVELKKAVERKRFLW